MSTSSPVNTCPAVGPYVGVQADRIAEFETPEGTQTFRLLLYSAFNALGLIGSESNGICILDQDRMQVLCDEIACEPTGWFGATETQWRQFKAMSAWDWLQFQKFINQHRRSRYEI